MRKYFFMLRMIKHRKKFLRKVAGFLSLKVFKCRLDTALRQLLSLTLLGARELDWMILARSCQPQPFCHSAQFLGLSKERDCGCWSPCLHKRL